MFETSEKNNWDNLLSYFFNYNLVKISSIFALIIISSSSFLKPILLYQFCGNSLSSP